MILKLAVWIIIGVFSLLALCVIFFFRYQHVSTMRTITLNGVHGRVEIARDRNGIAHIRADESDLDAFFGLGYIHAQDRFWQMEFQRRVAAGRLSEVFGASTLNEDQFLRTLGFYHAADAAWRSLNQATQTIIESYTAGVNAYLAKGKRPLSIKLLRYHPEPWSNIDSIVWQKMMAWDLQSTWEQKVQNYLIAQQQVDLSDVRYFKPPYPQQAPTILNQQEIEPLLKKRQAPTEKRPNSSTNHISADAKLLNAVLESTQAIRKNLGFEDMIGKGSNSWVVSGEFTKSGKPLLANDVHLNLSAPSLWYLAELQGPTLHVSGATIPGLPSVVIGHNQDIAWGVTNALDDAQDLYLLDSTHQLTKRTETIKVKGQADKLIEIEESSQGPIINGITEKLKTFEDKLALKWTALGHHDTTVQSFIKLNYARNWAEFNEALQDFVTPTQNFIYADRQGNIGYKLAGKIPIRKEKIAPLPLPLTEDNVWLGTIPFDELPVVYNPEKGFIATANNKIVPDSYPYPITFRWQAPPYRVQRIIDRIQQDQPFDVTKFEAIQYDTKDYFWLALKPYLLSTKPIDALSEQGLEILKAWDGEMRQDSLGATVFAYWSSQFMALIPERIQFGRRNYEALFILHYVSEDKNHHYLSQSLQQAMQLIIKQQGSHQKQWQWGNVHQAEFNFMGLGQVRWLGWMFNRKIPTSGGNYTVNVGSYDMDNFNQIAGATYRQIIDLDNLSNSVYVQTLGQSEQPLSPHYSDQMRLWANGEYMRMNK